MNSGVILQPLNDSLEKALNYEVIIEQSNYNNEEESNINLSFYIDDGLVCCDGLESKENSAKDVSNDTDISGSYERFELQEQTLKDVTNSLNISGNSDRLELQEESLKDVSNGLNISGSADGSELQINASTDASNTSNTDPRVPSPFKNFSFYPKQTLSSKKRRTPKVKVPSILSSTEGLQWYKDQQEKKRKIEDEKDLKRQIRIAKTLVKKEEAEKKKQKKKEAKKSVKVNK